MDQIELQQFFATRATVRSYSEREVEPQKLRRLLSLAAQAPTTGNMQLYSVIVSRSRAEREALAPAHFGQGQVTSGAAVVLTFCVDLNRYSRWVALGGADAGFDNLQALMYGVLDCAIFAQQFNTLAELHGLGCCYLGTTLFNAPQIADVLKLPPRVVPLLTLTVGYPASAPAPSDRLPIGAIIHKGQYADYADAYLRAAYADHEADPANRAFVAENGKENLAQVYAQVRYPRAMNEQFSTVLRDFLDRAVFNAGEQPQEQ